MDNVTSADVARLAGVSQTTVSRVFSNKGNVRSGTVDKVVAAAEQLGYMPNAIARSLTSQKTNIIAVVSVRSNHSFYSSIVGKVSARIAQLGKQMMYFQTDFEVGFDDIFHRVLQYKVDGLFIVSAAVSSEVTNECSRLNIPVVVFNRHVKRPGVFSLCSDNLGAARNVADYLVEKGYDSFAYIGSTRLSDTSRHRLEGFTQRLSELGFSDVPVALGDYSYDSGRSAMRQLLSDGKRVRAVFASNDLMAMGAMDAARYEFSLSVPQDIAIIGFDAIDEGAWGSYSLTTVEQPIDEMLEEACSAFSEELKLFPCRILKRSSA